MHQNDDYPNDEIDLKEIIDALWQGKRLIILITAFFAVCSVIYSLSLKNYYISESILVARESQDSSILNQYAGLASIAGIGLPGSSGDKVTEVMEIIKSREFVKHLMTFENVLPSMMAAKRFDSGSGELIYDKKLYDVKNKKWLSDQNDSKSIEPSYIEAHKAYQGMLSISRNKNTGLIYASFEHISPIFARDFLSLIIKEANILKRDKDIETSTKALSYLKKELSQTPLVEIKESINQLIEAQLETQMMANIHEEYSLAIIEPPFVPEEKSKPNRKIICLFGTALGGILSILLVLVRYYNVEK